MGAGQIFNLPRTDDFSRRGKVPSHLTAKVVSTVAFQNKIKNLSCTPLKQVDALLQFIYLLVILPDDLETKFEEESRTKYDIMDTTTKRKIPLIEDLMKKRKQERAEKERARIEGREEGRQ